MARILVTGGAGYLGSHTVAQLRRAGHEALVYDDLSNGHRQALDPDVKLVVGDVTDARRLATTVERWRPAAAVHLAGTPWYAEDTAPSARYRTDVLGTVELLDVLVPAGVPVVYCSTPEVHGAPWRLPVDELTPVMPTRFRARVAAEVEHALHAYGLAHGLRSTVLRVSEIAGADPSGRIGPAQKVAPSPECAAWAAVLGRGPEVVVHGDVHATSDGTCQRDIVHVTDAADAVVLAVNALVDGSSSQVFCVGTGSPSSVLDVLEAVGVAASGRVPRRITDPLAGDASAIWVDPRQARAMLGWTPRMVTLDEIVATSVRWHVGRGGRYAQEQLVSVGGQFPTPDRRNMALVHHHESDMAAALGGLADASRVEEPRERLATVRRLGRRVRPEAPGPLVRSTDPQAPLGDGTRGRAG